MPPEAANQVVTWLEAAAKHLVQSDVELGVWPIRSQHPTQMALRITGHYGPRAGAGSAELSPSGKFQCRLVSSDRLLGDLAAHLREVGPKEAAECTQAAWTQSQAQPLPQRSLLVFGQARSQVRPSDDELAVSTLFRLELAVAA